MNINSYKIYLFILVFSLGCEYERIAGPDEKCQTESLELVVESVQDTPCGESDGEIIVSVNGEDEYEYRLNDQDFNENNVFTGLAAGTYSIQARIVNSTCLSDEIQATINNEDGIQLSVVAKSDSDCGANTGSITVAQEGGVEPIEYILNNTNVQDSPEFNDLSNGSYTVVARDANNCEAEISGIDILSGISFIDNIKPIITSNCSVSGCHNGSQFPDFSDDQNIFENASNIKNRTQSGSMPPAGRPDLTDEEVQSIACWVDDGALDN
ncbi:hypothetical protein [Marivirga harenae]|uniref:hypothetical protein n=1 Tax=Marivirga harenae TaxID=2010992 RepID=UPI0026DF7997|nr:hypothetical protein [Marivirga harenae]WKV12282.1 hypothetical protein Q3Y49_00320 [Marivirga harenae]|tara:strand:+ start:24180 stop:24983 length:804 start_codon:yes stop_codon:yes gene_type:complete